MAEDILVIVHGAVLLLFGVSLTAAFSGIRNTSRNKLVFLGLCGVSGFLQLGAMLLFSEEYVWKLYPLITHLPLVLLLWLGYHRDPVSALAATFTAYLCCQPAKWAGVLARHLTDSSIWEYGVRLVTLVLVGWLILRLMAHCIAEIFQKDRRSVCIFGIVPAVYYLFDYATMIYTDLWISNNRVVAEFLPFFLMAVYMVFCVVYYREYEQKADAQRNEQIVRLKVEQQNKEMTAVKQAEQDIRLLRHDMRLFLSSLAVSIENGETDKAQEMITSQIDRIEGTRLQRFCGNETVNYVLSDYAARCKKEQIPFSCRIEAGDIGVDEMLFSSILSNALDNALNAQRLLPPDKRSIRLTMKTAGGKLLLSVKNPVGQKVVFSDGLPVSKEKGHGYGTQSIRYMTERLGGNCQFSVQGDTFILRVVL